MTPYRFFPWLAIWVSCLPFSSSALVQPTLALAISNQQLSVIAQAQSPDASSPLELKPATQGEKESGAKSQKQKLFWLILLGIIVTGTGSGLFVLFKVFNLTSVKSKPEDLEEEISEFNPTASKNTSLPSRYLPTHQELDTDIPLKHNLPKIAKIQAQNKSPSVSPSNRLAKVDIIEELIKDLRQVDPVKRKKSIWELAQLADSRAMQPLVDLMINADSQERSLILEAVSQIASRTLKPLNRALTIAIQDENIQVRKNAIRDLTRIYELISNVSQQLSMAVDDPDREVQETAKWALEQLNQIKLSANKQIEHLPFNSNSFNFKDNSRQ